VNTILDSTLVAQVRMPEPIMIESSRYHRLRLLGYIDEKGQLTEKAQDACSEYLSKIVSEKRAAESREKDEVFQTWWDEFQYQTALTRESARLLWEAGWASCMSRSQK
jgi:hypothetical protein